MLTSCTTLSWLCLVVPSWHVCQIEVHGSGCRSMIARLQIAACRLWASCIHGSMHSWRHAFMVACIHGGMHSWWHHKLTSAGICQPLLCKLVDGSAATPAYGSMQQCTTVCARLGGRHVHSLARGCLSFSIKLHNLTICCECVSCGCAALAAPPPPAATPEAAAPTDVSQLGALLQLQAYY